jgi:hypothetical protein
MFRHTRVLIHKGMITYKKAHFNELENTPLSEKLSTGLSTKNP